MSNSLVKVNRPTIVTGVADSMDANDNPIPTEPAANHPFGSLFYADSYPVGIDGAMVYKRENDAFSNPIWAWRWGDYRGGGSTDSDNYIRHASGWQTCKGFVAFTNGGSQVWTYAKPFAGTVHVHGSVYWGDTITYINLGSSPTSGTSVTIQHSGGTAAVGCYLTAEGRWK